MTASLTPVRTICLLVPVTNIFLYLWGVTNMNNYIYLSRKGIYTQWFTLHEFRLIRFPGCWKSSKILITLIQNCALLPCTSWQPLNLIRSEEENFPDLIKFNGLTVLLFPCDSVWAPISHNIKTTYVELCRSPPCNQKSSNPSRPELYKIPEGVHNIGNTCLIAATPTNH